MIFDDFQDIDKPETLLLAELYSKYKNTLRDIYDKPYKKLKFFEKNSFFDDFENQEARENFNEEYSV